jgi:hypothetical protein
MRRGDNSLQCDQDRSCEAPVTHIDYKGWIYCARHGEQRRSGGIRCRWLRSWERRQLEAGEPLTRYAP